MAQKSEYQENGERCKSQRNLEKKILFYGENSAQQRAEKQNISIYMQ